MVGELAVDARKVALSKEQCVFVLKRSGELIGVARQVGFFAGEAILRRLELGIECFKQPVVIYMMCALKWRLSLTHPVK